GRRARRDAPARRARLGVGDDRRGRDLRGARQRHERHAGQPLPEGHRARRRDRRGGRGLHAPHAPRAPPTLWGGRSHGRRTPPGSRRQRARDGAAPPGRGGGPMRRSPREVALDLVSPQRAVFLLLVVLLVAIVVVNPSFAEPGQLMRFLQRVAPVAIVAMGQYFVIVSGEFDLSMGSLVTAQVVGAGVLVGQDGSRTVPVLALMLAFGVLVGLVNGLATTFLRVPSFIVTLGMMLALLGAVMFWTGGAATGNPADEFRQIGRGGWREVPVLDFVPYAVVILVGLLVLALWYTHRPAGTLHVAVGDNVATAHHAGVRVWWVKTRAFVISSLSATVAGVLLVGYAGVHPS